MVRVETRKTILRAEWRKPHNRLSVVMQERDRFDQVVSYRINFTPDEIFALAVRKTMYRLLPTEEAA